MHKEPWGSRELWLLYEEVKDLAELESMASSQKNRAHAEMLSAENS